MGRKKNSKVLNREERKCTEEVIKDFEEVWGLSVL